MCVPQEFKTTILDSHLTWVLTVSETDDRCPADKCGVVLDVLNKVADKTEGQIGMAWIGAREVIPDESGELIPVYSKWNISDIPAAMIYQAGPKHVDSTLKFEPQMWGGLIAQGAAVVYNNLKQFVPIVGTPRLRSKVKVTELLASAPTDLPRVLLVTERAEVTLLFKSLSQHFGARAVFGQASEILPELKTALRLDAEAEKLPALFVVPAGTTKLPDADPATAGKWRRYGGGMSQGELAQWLNATLPPAPLPQIYDQASFSKHCIDKPGICFIALLPSSDAADGDNGPSAAFEAMRRLSDQPLFRPDFNTLAAASGGANTFVADRYQLSFAWVDASVQRSFASAFGNAPIPSLVALNPRKKLFALHRGSFTEANAREFLLAMMHYGLPNTPWSKGSRAAELVMLEPLNALPQPVTQVPREALQGKKKSAPSGKKKAAPAPAAADKAEKEL